MPMFLWLTSLVTKDEEQSWILVPLVSSRRVFCFAADSFNSLHASKIVEFFVCSQPLLLLGENN